MKSYTNRVVAINAFGDAIITLPDDLVKDLDWRLHDNLSFEIDGDAVIVKNITKEKREIKC